MSRLFSRLPVSLHRPAAIALATLAMLCVLIAVILFLIYSETTETTGHLWWKNTREIPYAERRPYLLAGIGFVVAAASLMAGTLELVVALARERRAGRRRRRDAAEARRLWEMTPEGQAARQAQEAEAQRRWAREASERAEREAARARRLWEESLGGQATLAYQRGDHYFSIELAVDGDLAKHLNEVTRAGWREESFGRRHERTSSSRPLYDGTHEVTRETVEYRTYLFQRG